MGGHQRGYWRVGACRSLVDDETGAPSQMEFVEILLQLCLLDT